ncbi:endonuclease [Carex littledalei]|uniref:Endonuclease n=1 Tax=Carex littledalei TaxID=544730 RepID=A0A833VAP0_9POAL|nr:endonuclease [Carex littledalei]
MASIASHGGIGLPFNCDIFGQFKGIGEKKLLGCPSPIVISNGAHDTHTSKWRIEAVGKKKRSRRSKAKQVEPGRQVQRDDDLNCFRGLILDFSYRPVNIVCWKRAFCLEFTEKADVLEYYDQTVSSPSGSFYIPAVLRIPELLQAVKRRVKQGISRQEVLFRDCYTCQYCSRHSRNLTIDHVIPTSRGGQWTWENLVSACFKCNNRKGQNTLEEANMELLSTPKAPEDIDIVAMPQKQPVIRMLQKKGVPEKWAEYVGKPKSTDYNTMDAHALN